MQIESIRWLPAVVEKLAAKHGVTEEEVESVLLGKPHVRIVEHGNVQGENLYVAMGQTDSGGRYLMVFFIAKQEGLALVISARTMSNKERRAYERR